MRDLSEEEMDEHGHESDLPSGSWLRWLLILAIIFWAGVLFAAIACKSF